MKIYNITGSRRTGKTTKAFEIIRSQPTTNKVLYYSSYEAKYQNQIERLIDTFGIVERYNLVFSDKMPTKKQMEFFDIIIFDGLDTPDTISLEYYPPLDIIDIRLKTEGLCVKLETLERIDIYDENTNIIVNIEEYDSEYDNHLRIPTKEILCLLYSLGYEVVKK